MVIFEHSKRLLVLAAWMELASVAFAADKPEAASTEQHEFGMVFQAQGGNFRSVSGTVTVPADWPDQQRVRIVKENLPPGAKVTYKKIEDVGRQMTVQIPMLVAGKEVRAVVVFEVERLPAPTVPQDAERFTAPKRDKHLTPYLSPSPRIESDAAPVRKAAETAVGDREKAWDKVKAIHKWVCENIKFEGGLENTQGAIQTLSVRKGVCAERNSLAVAMLRAQGIPARLVRIPGHCYYEVYLLDGEGQGHWFSADASSSLAPAPSSAARGLILQKGDNVSAIDPATRKRVKARFLAETATGTPQGRGGTVTFKPISPAIGAKPVVPKE